MHNCMSSLKSLLSCSHAWLILASNMRSFVSLDMFIMSPNKALQVTELYFSLYVISGIKATSSHFYSQWMITSSLYSKKNHIVKEKEKATNRQKRHENQKRKKWRKKEKRKKNRRNSIKEVNSWMPPTLTFLKFQLESKVYLCARGR